MLLAIAFFSLTISVIEHVRGWLGAAQDERLRLRALWRGWPAGAYGAFAFHEVAEPTRGRLRRSALAQIAFLICVALGLAATVAMAAPLANGASLIPIVLVGALSAGALGGGLRIALALWRRPR